MTGDEAWIVFLVRALRNQFGRDEQARLGLLGVVLVVGWGLAGGSEVEGRWWAPKDAAVWGDDSELLVGLHGHGPARFMDEGVVAATEKPHIVDVGGALVSVVLANVMGLAARRLGRAARKRTVTIASDKRTPLLRGSGANGA